MFYVQKHIFYEVLIFNHIDFVIKINRLAVETIFIFNNILYPKLKIYSIFKKFKFV